MKIGGTEMYIIFASYCWHMVCPVDATTVSLLCHFVLYQHHLMYTFSKTLYDT